MAAAGNSGPTGSVAGGTSCESNPLTDLGRPDDPRNWAGVTSVSIPSWWQPYVLSVASLTPDGQPSKFTMAGPWVGIAAPGENIVSVSNRDGGGLANGLPDDHQQLVALSGTSYAAGYVSGVAALVRSKYPELTATQVVRRITATAHNGARAPSNVVGAGSVDPVAALTWQLPAGNQPGAAPAKPVAVPPAPAPKDTTPRTVALAGTAALALLVAAAGAVAAIAAADERNPPREPASLDTDSRKRPNHAGAAGRGARGDGLPLAVAPRLLAARHRRRRRDRVVRLVARSALHHDPAPSTGDHGRHPTRRGSVPESEPAAETTALLRVGAPSGDSDVLPLPLIARYLDRYGIRADKIRITSRDNASDASRRETWIGLTISAVDNLAALQARSPRIPLHETAQVAARRLADHLREIGWEASTVGPDDVPRLLGPDARETWRGVQRGASDYIAAYRVPRRRRVARNVGRDPVASGARDLHGAGDRRRRNAQHRRGRLCVPDRYAAGGPRRWPG